LALHDEYEEVMEVMMEMEEMEDEVVVQARWAHYLTI